MTQSGEEAVGLDLFDETASAAGNFPQSLRGYERTAVDSYVRDVEHQLARVKAQLRQTQRLLSEANLRVDDTDYARLGAHTRSMLRAAEAQAAELVRNAQEQAERIRRTAENSSQELSEVTKLALGASQASSLADIEELRERLGSQTANELQAAKDEATSLREAARRDGEQIVAEARAQAEALAAGSRADSEAAAAEQEAASAAMLAELAATKAESLADIAASAEQAKADLERVVETSRQQADEYRERLESDSHTWAERREAALAEAAQITFAAQEEARVTVEKARNEATALVNEASRAAEDRKEKLTQELDRLSLRRAAIVAQLESLSLLATDTVQAMPIEDEPEREATAGVGESVAPAEAVDEANDGSEDTEETPDESGDTAGEVLDEAESWEAGEEEPEAATSEEAKA